MNDLQMVIALNTDDVGGRGCPGGMLSQLLLQHRLAIADNLGIRNGEGSLTDHLHLHP